MKNWNLVFHKAVLLILSCTALKVSSQCFTKNDTDVSTSTNSYIDGSIDFAVALFKSVSETKAGANDNVFISPFSVHSALTITYIGTLGNTKAQLETGLHLGNSNQKQVIHSYHEFKDGLLHNATSNANYTFNTANKLYFDQTVELRKCILDYLAAETEKLNFVGSPDPSREVINKWVEDQTNNKIVNLIPPGFINSDTRIVIVNAAYFKGYWMSQFQNLATQQKDFFVDTSTTIKIAMMHQSKTFLFAKDLTLDCSAVELPYSGNKISMVILLPNENIKIEQLIAKITKESLRNLYATLNSYKVNLTIPKFKLEQSIELTNEVKSLGVTDLFEANQADLSGFTGRKGMFVGFIQHKTFIAVDEGGTEAAAATAVGIGKLSISVEQPVDFLVNRPFVFFIRDKESDSILFIGTIRDPSNGN